MDKDSTVLGGLTVRAEVSKASDGRKPDRDCTDVANLQ
jgi:hypothetical protein